MGTYRNYNPYTKYGRRKVREQAYRNIQNYTPEEKEQYNKTYFGCSVLIIIGFIIVCFLIYSVAGMDALKEWLR